MKRAAVLLVLLAPLCVGPARAQPARPVRSAQPAQPAQPSGALTLPAPLERSAIGRVAAALAQDLARVPGRALVIAAPLTSDAPAPRGAQLVAQVAAQIAGRRGQGARARLEPMPLDVARAAARSDGVLVHIGVEITAGRVRVTADVYPVPRNVWAKIRDPEPGPVAHAFAEAPLDAEVRTFLAPIPLVALHVDRAKSFEGDIVALACGDLDRDGAPEIVTVGRRRVSAVRLRAGHVVPIFSRSWPDLSPVAPAPLREPVGFAQIIERGPLATPVSFVDVGISDRARGARLDASLQVAVPLLGLALPDGDGSACARPGGGGLALFGPLAPCTPGDPPPRALLPSPYDAFASARLLSAGGAPFTVWAGRDRGALDVRDDAGHRLSIEGAGAQVAIGDLDQDGSPEILASLDTLNPIDDAVVVRTWALPAPRSGAPFAKAAPSDAATPHAKADPRAQLTEVMRLPAASGVRALAVCPPDGPGRAPFVVATSDELWVVR